MTVPSREKDMGRTPQRIAAVSITLLGFLARLWAAHGTFLNPDEALHFRLANQLSLSQAYRESLTASHPPLLTVILYFWRDAGTSELWLRMPGMLAGVIFCWMFYKWLDSAAGQSAGFIGLLFAAFLPPVVALSGEIRQYGLLLAFLASALYFLDAAFEKKSPARMAWFTLCLYLAMLSHYSAFLMAAAFGIYALLRILQERPPAGLIWSWAIGQLGALALAAFLYETHISKLGVGESRTALQGWMSDFFLRRSYFDPAHDNPFTFLVGHSFGVFQYLFGQLAVGIVMGLLFVAGVTLLLRGESSLKDRISARRLGAFLLLPFAVAAAASLAHVYPYGGTRHIAFLVIPAIAGVSVALARLSGEKRVRGIAIAACVIVACVALGKARRPTIDRADQSRAHMADALEYLQQNVAPSTLIFTDYESELILGHYLCAQKPIVFETSTPDFEAFSCGARVIASNYRATRFTAENFSSLRDRFIATYRLAPGDTIWVVQAGWDADLPEQLRSFAGFHDLRFESFGKNIKILRLPAQQPPR